jgi:uncharacterized protein YbbK (DUF523 family)
MPRESAFARLEGPVLVSACLLGIQCRYDGSSKTNRPILKLPGIILIPVCPEQLGGLPTPRPRAHFIGGDGQTVVGGRARIITEQGQDVTAEFLLGASQACKIARITQARYAILKERSPSCGAHTIWIEGCLKDGPGLTAAMLGAQGVCIMNEDGQMLRK